MEQSFFSRLGSVLSDCRPLAGCIHFSVFIIRFTFPDLNNAKAKELLGPEDEAPTTKAIATVTTTSSANSRRC